MTIIADRETGDTEHADRVVQLGGGVDAGNRALAVANAEIGLAFDAEIAVEVIAAAQHDRIQGTAREFGALVTGTGIPASVLSLGCGTGCCRRDGCNENFADHRDHP